MSYGRFMSYNVVGGAGWVLLCTLAGYLFGNLPFVQKNFSLVVLVDHLPLAAAGGLGDLAGPRARSRDGLGKRAPKCEILDDAPASWRARS